MKGAHWIRLPVLFLVLVIANARPVVFGQDPIPSRKFKSGDDVLCFHAGEKKLWPAKVTKVDGKKITIEFEYEGAKLVQTLDAKLLQFAWEERAISKVRTWKDLGGKFQVVAAAVRMDVAKGEVILHRIDNDEEISVSVSRLSQTDQDFLATLSPKSENATVGSGSVEQFELLPRPAGSVIADMQGLTMAGNEMYHPVRRKPDELPGANEENRFGDSWPEPQDWIIGVPRDMARVPAEANPPVHNLTIGNIPFPSDVRPNDLGKMLFAGGPEEWVLTTSFKGSAKLFWISLRNGTVLSQPWNSNEALLDVDLENKQVLSSSFRNEKVCLTVWNCGPDSTGAEPRCTWDTRSWGFRVLRNESPLEILQAIPARLVSKDRVFHVWCPDDLACVMWDVAAKKEVWHINEGHAFGNEHGQPCIAVSAGKKYLAVSQSMYCRVLEMETGKTVAFLGLRGVASALAFDPGGQQLAIVSNRALAVWKLGSDKPPVTGWVPNQQFRNMHWIDANSLLLDGNILFDVRKGFPVWEFISGERTSGFRFGFGNCCTYLSMDPSGSKTLLCTQEFPLSDIQSRVSGEDKIPGSILYRGVHLKTTKKRCPEDPEIDRLVKKSIEHAGWVLDPSADLAIDLIGGSRAAEHDARYVFDSTGAPQSLVWTYGKEKLVLAEIGIGSSRNWQLSWSPFPPQTMYASDRELFQSILDEWTSMHTGSSFDIQFPQNLSDWVSIRQQTGFTGFGTSTYDTNGFTEK